MSHEVADAGGKSKADNRSLRQRVDDSSQARWRCTVDYLDQLSRAGNRSGSDGNSAGLPEKPAEDWQLEITVDKHGARFTYRGLTR